MSDASDASMPPELLKSAAQRFWALVLMEQATLQELEPIALMERLNAVLESVIPGLATEVAGVPSPDDADGTLQSRLVFTAHGDLHRFAAVQAVIDTAPPELPWPVEAFRQRSSEGFAMRMEGFELASKDVLLRVGQLDGKVALALSFGKPVPMDMREHARQMAFILLDHMLGEFDFSVKVGVVEFEDEGVSDDAGFDRCPRTPLDDAVGIVDACWRDSLARSAQYPAEPHRWAALEGVDGEGVTIVVQVNRSANALVARADLGWRVQASWPVADAGAIQAAQAFEEAWLAAACLHQQGICTHVVLRAGVRSVHCYVADAAHATAAARMAAQGAGGSTQLQIQAVHEPDWSDYLAWYVECAQ
ncbi:MAG: hypothetical protein EOO31_08020 [Comamonadaceae bacterium]|nr:MAG: hypothetical protein EOO31_08020 [Comamonadaceae bacterium]